MDIVFLFVTWENQLLKRHKCASKWCAYIIFCIVCFTVLSCSPSPSGCSSQCADVSSPIPMLKALFFSHCGPGCPASLNTRFFLEANKQPFSRCLSLSFILSSSIPPLLCRKQNGWVGTGMHHLATAQSTRPEVTEAWPPTTGLIVEILKHACTHSGQWRCRTCLHCQVACHYSAQLICSLWLWISVQTLKGTDVVIIRGLDYEGFLEQMCVRFTHTEYISIWTKVGETVKQKLTLWSHTYIQEACGLNAAQVDVCTCELSA